MSDAPRMAEFGVVARFNADAKRGRLNVLKDGKYTGEEIYFHLRDGRKLRPDKDNRLIVFTDERVHPVHDAVLRSEDAVVVFVRSVRNDKAKPWAYAEDYDRCLQELATLSPDPSTAFSS